MKLLKVPRNSGFGFSSFYPGPGLGGHCIPVDPFFAKLEIKRV